MHSFKRMEMRKILGGLQNELERKRKYFWISLRSFWSLRRGAMSTAGILILYVFILYVSFRPGFIRKVGDEEAHPFPFPSSLHTSSGNVRLRKNIIMPSVQNRIRSPDSKGEQSHVQISKTWKSEEKSTVPSVSRNRVEKVFTKVDRDGDGFLSKHEISSHINEAVKAHFVEALNGNFDNFFAVDIRPRDGLIRWKEWLAHFSDQNGLPEPITPDDIEKKTNAYKNLSKNIKVEIARSEARWSESASSNPDFLTVDEFLAFQHAEASPTKLLALVSDAFNSFDGDGDGVVSQKEFETTFSEAGTIDNVYSEDLKLIDVDRNGIINRVEMMKYLDPRHPHHSEREAQMILNKSDSNRDGKLSLDEIYDNSNLIVQSSLTNVVKNLHKSILDE